MSASESWSAQREALAVEALRRTGRLRLQVRGESMLPALWPGDLAEIDTCALQDVHRGEIVLASQGGRFFLHRFLVRCPTGEFLTLGDSMPGPDPRFPSSAFLGRLVRVVRAGRTVFAPAPLRPWSRVLGMLFCHCSLARRLALKFHRRRTAEEPIAEVRSKTAAVKTPGACKTAEPLRSRFGNLTSDFCNPPIP